MNKLEKVLAEYHHDWQLAGGNWQLATTTAMTPFDKLRA